MDFLKMHSCPHWGLALSSHPTLGWAPSRGGRGGRKFLRLLRVKVGLPPSLLDLSHPQGPRFLR